jgi:hypothetical protein
LNNT